MWIEKDRIIMLEKFLETAQKCAKDCLGNRFKPGKKLMRLATIILILAFFTNSIFLKNVRLTVKSANLLVVTSTADNGPGSLREAIELLAADDDSIVFAGVSYIKLDNPIAIDVAITIDGGDGVTIDGDNSTGIFIFSEYSRALYLKYLNLTNATTAIYAQGYHDGTAYVDTLELENCVLENNTNSAISSVYTSSLILDDCKFLNNTNASGGGAIFADQGNVTVTDSTFNKNSSKYNGGAIYISHGDLTINKSLIEENIAKNDGGGVYIEDGNLTVNNSKIKNNTADANGGGVYIDRGNIKMTAGSISGNKGFYGGGVCLHIGELEMIDSSISDNFAYGQGGGVNISDGNITMTGSSINDNIANSYDGGGVYHYKGNLTMTDSSISGNVSDYNGGGVSLFFGNFTMFNSTIKNNKAGRSELVEYVYDGTTYYYYNCIGDGGGVIVRSGDINLSDSEISKNTAGKDGGGLAVYGDPNTGNSLSLSGGKINENTAGYSGGGIFISNYKAKMESGEIFGNTAHGYQVNDGGGGVALVSGTDFTMNDGNIHENSAHGYGGGGVSVVNAIFTMTGGMVDENKADMLGGGVGIGGNKGKFILQGGLIKNNTASTGGGVGIAYGEFTMTDGKLDNNKADINGGGVYNKNGSMNMTGGSIDNNFAIVNGGGIYTELYDKLTVKNKATLSGNKAGNSYWLEIEEDDYEYDPGSGSIRADALRTLHDLMISVVTRSIPRSGSYKPFKYLYNNYDINFVGTLNEVEMTKYSLTYNANGGTGGLLISNIEEGTTVKILSDSVVGVSRDGYIFIQWNTKADGNGTAYTAGDTLTMNTNTELFAIWSSNPPSPDTGDNSPVLPSVILILTNGGLWILIRKKQKSS